MAGILHIALDDRWNAGGRRLHEELLMRGSVSELWVFEKTSVVPQIFQIRPAAVRRGQWLNLEDWQQILHGRPADTFDKIIVHGLDRAVSPELLPMLGKSSLFWGIDSCGTYTAGCSHSAHCGQWETACHVDCSGCPEYAGRPAEQQRQIQLYQAKRDSYSKIRLEFLCQNEWQQEQLGRSIAADQSSRVLPEMLNTECFYPGDYRAARRALGLPENAFVFILPVEFGNGREAVLQYIQKTLAELRSRYHGYLVLVQMGSEDALLPGELAVDEVRHVPMADFLRGAYYRAADLQLWFAGTDISYRLVREAGLCALPSVLFDIGAARRVVSDETGFVVPQFDGEALQRTLLDVIHDPAMAAARGMRFYEACRQTDGQLAVWLQLCQGSSPAAAAQSEAESGDYTEIFRGGVETVRTFLEQEIKEWTEQPEDTPQQKTDKKCQKALFVDQFCLQWLRTLQPEQPKAVWELLAVWLKLRGLALDERFTSQEGVDAHLLFCHELRAFLVRYFQCTPLKVFSKAAESYTDTITRIWYFMFLNTKSVVNRMRMKLECPQEILQQEGQTGYPLFFLWSMFTPFVPKYLDIHVDKLLTANLPVSLRIVTTFWLIAAPLYNGNREQQQAILTYIRELCQFLGRDPDAVSPSLRLMLMDGMMIALWRLSYYGGNNIISLRAYGDYLQQLVKRHYHEYSQPMRPRHRRRGERLRIGYISVNFRNQAVPQYMANRLQYRNRERFWMKTFILQMVPADKMTRQIQDWSDESETFTIKDSNQLSQTFARIASAVRKSELDLLIYTDIGMNNVTYLLGAMQLAPVQAVLVGHGTTSGLTSIDYYVSGDHEPANAQQHYTEKIIRLPNAGAAQLPPNQGPRTLSRADYGIPEEAVVFVSCANGLKHVPERDRLLVEILQKAPNAYIMLKPFMSNDAVDWKLRDRILAAAREAGVEERMKIVPPLPDSGDLMAFIQLADVQLDTYPYGGWTTNLEALYYHLPIVTQQGDMARSRWGARLLEVMGIQEGIAHDEREYVDWAVRFAQDEGLRQSVRDRIAAQAEDKLFNGPAAQPAYEAALVQMIEDKERKAKKKSGKRA